MIFKLTRYFFKYYLKTFKYVVPLLFFIIFVIVYFSSNSSDIWGNYYFTSAAMFIFAAWLTVGFVDFEDSTQQQITIIHTGNINLYYISKILTNWILTIFFDVCIVFIPIILGKFNRSLTVNEIFIALIIHFISSLLGVAVSLLFDLRLISERKLAMIGLFSIIILTISESGIISDFHYLKFIIWILPPIYLFYEKFNTLSPNSFYLADKTFLASAAYSLIYCLIIITGYIRLLKRKMF